MFFKPSKLSTTSDEFLKKKDKPFYNVSKYRYGNIQQQSCERRQPDIQYYSFSPNSYDYNLPNYTFCQIGGRS